MGKINHLFIVILISILSFQGKFMQISAQDLSNVILRDIDSVQIVDNISKGYGVRKVLIHGAAMSCDSAYYNESAGQMEAFGHVFVNRGDTLKLWGDYMKYTEIDSTIRVRKDVVLVNKDARLVTQALDYNMIKDVGYYPVKGQIFNGENELTSKKGYYYTNLNMSYFIDSVVIHSPDYTIYSDSMKYDTENKITYFLDSTHIINEDSNIKCRKGWYNTVTRIFEITKDAYMENKGRVLEGDTVYFNDSTQYGRAKSNVVITDTVRNVMLTGGYAEYYRNPEKAYVTDSAVMIQLLDGDSLFLHADTIRLISDTVENRAIIASYRVKYFKSNLQGKCDSLYYSVSDSVLQFHGEPVIWSGENQITANYIEIFMKDDALDYMNMNGVAFVVSQEDSTKFNQVKGKVMIGYFKENELYLIDVNGNGQSVYYLKDNEDMIGVNLSVCSNIQIHVRQRKPYVIKNLVKPESTLFPLDQAPADRLVLEKFKWLIEYRPLDKNDIFYWK